MIGGLVTSTLLTLFVVPSVYGWFRGARGGRCGSDGDAAMKRIDAYVP